MTKIASVAVTLLVSALLAGALAGCTPSSSPSTSSASTSSSTSSSSEANIGVTDTLIVDLPFNAGTGYEWQCSLEPEGVLEIVTQGDIDMSGDQDITGGPLLHSVTVRAKSAGTATLICQLVRPWETGIAPAEEQTYVFKVDDNLKLSFDAAASKYVNEPGIGANS